MSATSKTKTKNKRKKSLSFAKRFNRTIRTSQFAKRYLVFSIIVLAATTLFWSIFSALVSNDNADQLVNGYLLQNPNTFFGAVFPDQHTFLLKLPLFLLIHVLGSTPFAFVVVTVFTVLLTVGALAYLLYRVEKRPLLLATILLALSASLMLIPAQPYAGGLLPVNMAMVTTRNLEYIVFIVSLALIIRAKGYFNKYMVWSLVCMTILIASDKLFLSLSIGGAVLSLVTYFFAKRKELIRLSFRWLIVSVASFLLATGLLFGLNKLGLIHISTPVGAGPYALIHSFKDFAIGIVYGIGGIFTNFGANPVYDVRVIKDIPGQFFVRLFSVTGTSFVITILIAISVCIATYKLFIKSIVTKITIRKNLPQHHLLLALMLIWSSIVAGGVFVFSNHYYPVDSRYLTIVLFAGFIAVASFVRGKKIHQSRLIGIGAILIIGILLSIPFTITNFTSSRQAISDLTTRNTDIANVLQVHPVSTLVGDYWRVIPTRELSGNKITVTPLSDCTTPRDVLNSSAWQPNLATHSFAYLLSFDGSNNGFPSCSLDQVTKVYGQPNESTVIKGTVTHPVELLLFYDHGIHIVKNQPKVTTQAAVVPLTLATIPHTTCPQSTIMQFVAHEDDDILFMSPDLLHTIQSGDCVRTVYFTAGDAGNGQAYWISRQKGAEAAYDTMIGQPNAVWNERIVKTPDGQFVTVANPHGNNQVSLIFMHLPDGNPQGNGFASTGFQSLKKLYTNAIPSITTVDSSSTYTAAQLRDTLVSLMQTYVPAELRSQSADASQGAYKDHSDHTNVAHFTTGAYNQYITDLATRPSIVYYMGYPIHSFASNVSGTDLDQKTQAFLAFGAYDGATCQTIEQCDNETVYGLYLDRQYKNSY